MKIVKSSLKTLSVLILMAAQLFAGNVSEDLTLNQTYGNIGLNLNKLKEAYPYYFKSADSKPPRIESTCENILRLLSKDEVKLLSITDFGAKEFDYVSVVLITNKNVYYSKSMGNDSFVASKSASDKFLSSIRSKIAEIKGNRAKNNSLRACEASTFVVLYSDTGASDIFISRASPFPKFSEGDDRVITQIRRDSLAWLGLDVLGQGVTMSNYKILAEELNKRVSKYLERNELLLFRGKYYSHTLNELLYYYATSTEEFAPLMYVWILNVNGILAQNEPVFSLVSVSERETNELKKSDSLLAKYILYSYFMKSGDKSEASLYKKELQEKNIDPRLIEFWNSLPSKD